MKTTYHRWTEQETEKLLSLVEQHGKKWKYIQQHYFNYITSDSIRSKYNEYEKQLNSQEKEKPELKEIEDKKQQNFNFEKLPYDYQLIVLAKSLNELLLQQEVHKENEENNGEYKLFIQMFK